MKLGFVGTGTIAAAMIEGLCAVRPDLAITVSPRNAEIAAALTARHGNVRVAASNQAVLDESDMVVLAVRPQIVREVLPELRFRADHHVLSLIATVSLDYLREATAPAERITRAVPLPSVERHQGPTAIFPADPVVANLFDALGSAIPLKDEDEFDIFTAATSTMAAYFAFAGTITGWMEREGVAAETARAFVGQLLAGLATANPQASFAALADEHQTRGGLNEQVVRAVAADGTLPELRAALDSILTRLRRDT